MTISFDDNHRAIRQQAHAISSCRRRILFKLCIVSMLVHIALTFRAHAERPGEVYFDPRLVEHSSLETGPVDLSIFTLSDKAQIAGTYDTTIYVNQKKILQQQIRYDQAADGSIVPQITPDLLRALNVNVDAFPELVAHKHNAPLQHLSIYIPAADAKLDFNLMKLDISIPQAAMNNRAKDFVDPATWDDGVPVLFSNYTFSGAKRENKKGSNNSNQYMNLQNGFNAGPWRFRNYTTYSSNEGENSWDVISTNVERDIKFLKSKMIIGESSTAGDIFPSQQFTGIQMSSDENMLPNSMKGFAPTIRGIANSNAEVTIRQNGYIIYQSYVAPGAFEITDLYPTSYSGDLEVTVKEADGTERRFNQPFAAVPVMQRPGRLKYSATLARYRAADKDDREPEFAQATAIYGVSNDITLYTGTLLSTDYLAGIAGAGFSLHSLGSVSVDMTYAQTTLDNNESHNGQSYRIQYSKNIEATETNVTLAGYRYSTAGFYDFDEANEHQDDSGSSSLGGHKRSKLQVSINQSLWEGASIYFSAYQQDYWQRSESEKNLALGLNFSSYGINYNLTYIYSQLEDEDNDQQIALNVRIPLSRWLPNSWASYNVTQQKGGDTRQQIGLSGTALDDNRLSYNLQQSHTDHGGGNSSSLYSSYRSHFGTINVGYNYDDSSRQTSYGMSGGIVAHSHGITLSQPLSNSFALIDTNGASGARIQNVPGLKTDWRGYAIVPYLTPYSENRISIDTTTLPEDIDIKNSSEMVIPNKGAMVTAHFDAHIGVRALIKLVQPGNKPVPFGAVAVSEDQTMENIVDDGGILYLTGITPEKMTALHVKWGVAATQQCRANIKVNASGKSVQTLTAQCI